MTPTRVIDTFNTQLEKLVNGGPASKAQLFTAIDQTLALHPTEEARLTLQTWFENLHAYLERSALTKREKR